MSIRRSLIGHTRWLTSRHATSTTAWVRSLFSRATRIRAMADSGSTRISNGKKLQTRKRWTTSPSPASLTRINLCLSSRACTTARFCHRSAPSSTSTLTHSTLSEAIRPSHSSTAKRWTRMWSSSSPSDGDQFKVRLLAAIVTTLNQLLVNCRSCFVDENCTEARKILSTPLKVMTC